MKQKDKSNAVCLFHFNLNCTDLDCSTTFYELIGFHRVIEFEETDAERSFADIGLVPILRVPEGCKARARFLMLGDDPRATRLDLIEWTLPPTRGRLSGDLTAVGVPRICLRVRNADEMHEGLSLAGHQPYSPPTEIDMGGTRQRVFCCPDPDGFIVEFMEFLRQERTANREEPGDDHR
ncbi:hypothetical protein SAMN04490248_12134 [Salinihabitans flavidus]|uniref:VOC domain-containing protein n=1 Tax=Salinihabitans flavidus TaxID=569882 RepID=A0A1H8UNZ1_9RHOB|nr:VOC family protein [Salinihabitans flavidus]SEP04861.1 hypothetical protein SAMN04490248_12134 [Salinihabitans flavidus]